jgi:O-antigen/teichoic acid export membrane protein
MPILTRVFTVKEYGLLALASSTIFFAMAIMKLGVQNAVVRYVGEGEDLAGSFYASLFYGPMILCIFSLFFYLLTVKYILHFIGIENEFITTFYLIGAVSCVRSVIAIGLSFLRATQKIISQNFFLMLMRLLGFVVPILIIFHWQKNLAYYFSAALFVDAVIFLLLIYCVFRGRFPSPRQMKFDILVMSYRYSIPLFFAELMNVVLYYSDRFLLQKFCGLEQVAMYTVAYSLAMPITSMLVFPLTSSSQPIFFETYRENGLVELQALLSRTLLYFLLIAVPIFFLIAGSSGDLITLLATIKYYEAHKIAPAILLSELLLGSLFVLNIGLHIFNKTKVIAVNFILGCCLNLILNYFIIPKYGMNGAALTTLLSSLYITVTVSYFSSMEIKIPVNLKQIFIFIFAGIIMYSVTVSIVNFHIAIRLILKIVFCPLIYITIVAILCSDIRIMVISKLKKLLTCNFKL